MTFTDRPTHAELTDERTERVGRNEALYRQVNERIQDLNEAFSPMTGDFSVVCECGDLHCTEQLRMSPHEYERVRANPTLFILKPGHEQPDVEQAIKKHDGFIVVEKLGGPPTRIAEQTNPRG